MRHLPKSSSNMLYLVLLLTVVALASQPTPCSAVARIPNNIDIDNALEPRAPVPRHHKSIRTVKIVSPPGEVFFTPGEKLYLQCKVIGSPGPRVAWLKNGEPYLDYEEQANEVLTMHPSSIVHVMSKLVVTDAVDADVYTCLAVGIKQDSVSYTLVADEAGTTDNLLEKLLSPPKPVITFFYTGVFQDQGTAIILPCRVYGDAEVYWQDQSNNILHNTSRMRVLPSGDLLIQNLRWSDMGEYTCVAANEFGKDSQSMFLYPVIKTFKNLTA